ncbi:WD repeat-containing protein on Y chromosome-like isoform X5 [Mesocricetus auratus]|uniref:WD repeat-containing protein on Y chromosome-like isoform X5 n=1 Tax=Mesocricetus auratus TaxID=10036 RepID=A0ABM2XXG3_MESAU|nr:WD repeat-containing protein on Y chromosome-like isoform X5 [Mesocricetus auratus]
MQDPSGHLEKGLSGQSPIGERSPCEFLPPATTSWRRRSSSALGRLETCQESSILKPAAILGEPVMLRAQTSPTRPQPSGKPRLQSVEPPDWLLRTCLTQERMCSHSVSTLRKTPLHHADLAHSLRAEKIEHQVNLEELQHLHALFEEHGRRGRHLLDMETFKCIMKQSMRPHSQSIGQIEQLFMKIDYEAVGRIQWDSLCTYLQLEYSEQAKAAARRAEATLLLPAVQQRLSYGRPMLRILSMPDDTLITIREDGAIYFWSLQLKLKRKKPIFGKSTSRKSQWVTDIVSMPQYNKLIVGTGSRKLQLYELSNLEPYCQIGGLEAVPLKLDYCSMEHDKCLILYGDDQGCVNIMVLTSAGELLRTWKKMPKDEDMPSISIHTAAASPNTEHICWKVHGDCVTQLNYYDSMKAVISSSNHEPTALVIGFTMGATNVKEKLKEIRNAGKTVKMGKSSASLALPQRRAECGHTVFCIHKGVKTFSFCRTKNLLVTGGVDRIVRVWNPYLPGKPTGVLRGHMAPVVYVHISSEENKVFSVSADNTVKIWDLETHGCCFTASSKASGIKGELAACLYLSGPRALCVATDALAFLHLKAGSAPEPHLARSHQEPVVCCRYNPTFRHVVSCCEASVVKVWDFETGRQVSEFIGTHGNAGITCLTFDSSGRRLITGGRDGCLKIWSYNNGHCLHTLQHDENRSEVCDCTYMEVNQNRCVIAVGWDRRINVYFDIPCDFHHFWKPQPHWQDNLNHGHKEDILCVAQCPPFLLATSSYDGEIIVWNVISGHVHCKLNSPSPVDDQDPGEGQDRSVSRLAFLKTRATKLDSAAASLISNGPEGSVNFWKLFSGAGLIANFIPSRGNARVSSIVVTSEDTLTYLADQQGFVHVYDIQKYGLQGPELQAPNTVTSWKAHDSTVTSLELIERDDILLSSSLDCTVSLWSRDGAYIGTFGQNHPWDVFTPASWSHTKVPFEILTAPQSMPSHLVLETDTGTGCPGGWPEQDDVMEKAALCETAASTKKTSLEDARAQMAQHLPGPPVSRGHLCVCSRGEARSVHHWL